MAFAPAPAAAAGRWRDVDGILLLDKPEGMTSNAALQRARRGYRARKAGHTGSLDPFASGLLPLCFGQATKASGLLLAAGKTYRVRIRLGIRTATGDRDGEVLERASVPPLTEAALRPAASGFIGDSMQVPPMYSALKHRGERLYRLARRGIDVERAPRPITIRRMDVLEWGGDWVALEVECSKGTYVRSLAEDFAATLGTVGHVATLRRVALGPFAESGMHALTVIEAAASRPGDLDRLLLPPDAALPDLAAVQLGADEQASLLHGRPVAAAGPGSAPVRIYGADGRFLGVGRMDAAGERLAPERIMVEVPAGKSSRA